MKKFMFTLLAVYVLAFIGCATPAKKVEAPKPKPTNEYTAVPKPNPNEAAIFGKVLLTETINESAMPVKDQDAVLYMDVEGRNMTMKISCSDSGEFGVYLPEGSYRLTRIIAGDFKFKTDMTLKVPADQKAVYVGTIVLDGAPTGIEPGTGKTNFAFSVRDEQREYEARIRKALPEVDVAFYKSLFTPRGGIMTSSNPTRVYRAKDLGMDLKARTDAMEGIAGGVIMSFSYILNPIWIFTVGH